jgi:predicted membrane-bound spermidine synthase
MSPQAYAKLAVLMGGVVGLGVELAAERLLAPSFGTTLDLWSIIIGLTFTALSAGYEIGGRIIDRRPHHRVVSVCLLIAGAWSLLIALLGRTIVDAIQEFTFDFGGLRLGIFLSALLLITLPPFVIGIITPSAIRLVVPRVGASGSSAGTIYALGTVGALFGTFLPVIVLIPRIGVRYTFLCIAAVGLTTGALGFTNLVRDSAAEMVAEAIAEQVGERVAR